MGKLPNWADDDFCWKCGRIGCTGSCNNDSLEPDSVSGQADDQPPEKLGFFSTVMASIIMVLFLGTLLGPLLVLPTILVFLFQ